MLLKISEFLEIVSLKLRQKAIYYELKHYIKKRKTYLKPIHYYNRGIGKTYSLVKLSKKYKCPILVCNENYRSIIKRFDKKGKIQVVTTKNFDIGMKFDLLLCDEQIDISFIENVVSPRCKCIVGFVKEY